jgi:hypothetical protein
MSDIGTPATCASTDISNETKTSDGCGCSSCSSCCCCCCCYCCRVTLDDRRDRPGTKTHPQNQTVPPRMLACARQCQNQYPSQLVPCARKSTVGINIVDRNRLNDTLPDRHEPRNVHGNLQGLMAFGVLLEMVGSSHAHFGGKVPAVQPRG